MYKLLMICLTTVLLCSCAGMQFNVCGINVSEMRDNAKAGDYGELLLGAAASLAAHVTGHYLACKAFGVDIHYYVDDAGMHEIMGCPDCMDDSKLRWAGRGGFVFQLAVNTALVELANDSYFTKGYTAFTSIELLTYSLRHPDNGDFGTIDRAGGNGNLEYLLYTGWAAYNFYRISFEEERIEHEFETFELE